MSGINFLSDNFVDLADLTITTGAANAQFPLSNIQNISTAKKFRSTGSAVVIELDLQQTKGINITQNNFSISSFKYGYSDKSNVRPNRYGQKFIDKLPLRKILGGTIEFATKDEQETLDDMFLRHGIHLPLWVIIDDTSSGMNEGEFKLTMYSFLNQVPIWTASGGQTYNASLDLDQVI